MGWIRKSEINNGRNDAMLFSGREDNLHRQGVGILMSKNATKALISWKSVNVNNRSILL